MLACLLALLCFALPACCSTSFPSLLVLPLTLPRNCTFHIFTLAVLAVVDLACFVYILSPYSRLLTSTLHNLAVKVPPILLSPPPPLDIYNQTTAPQPQQISSLEKRLIQFGKSLAPTHSSDLFFFFSSFFPCSLSRTSPAQKLLQLQYAVSDHTCT